MQGFYELDRLFFSDTNLGLVLFDLSRLKKNLNFDPNVFQLRDELGLFYTPEFITILVGTRMDMMEGRPELGKGFAEKIFYDMGFTNFAWTSALTGAGCLDLTNMLYDQLSATQLLDKADVPRIGILRNEIEELQNGGTLVIRTDELFHKLRIRYPEELFSAKLLNAYIAHLAYEGMIKRLSIEDYLLLYPGHFYSYAEAIVYYAQNHPRGLGIVPEGTILDGTLELGYFANLKPPVKEIIVKSIVQEFIKLNICSVIETTQGKNLLFPHRINETFLGQPLLPSPTSNNLDVFISYSRKDIQWTGKLVSVLEALGLNVWWDSKIMPGTPFDDSIDNALQTAKCVVVLWSKSSVKSHWVKTEASEGLRKKVLIPVEIEEVVLPLAFRRIQTARLHNWNGSTQELEFKKLLASIKLLISI